MKLRHKTEERSQKALYTSRRLRLPTKLDFYAGERSDKNRFAHWEDHSGVVNGRNVRSVKC